MKKLGLIVNPLAGIGGRVGLKGSDGLETVQKAFELGAEPHAPDRAIAALEGLTALQDDVELYTYPAEMGEDEARHCGFSPIVLGSIDSGHTTAEDTRQAARDMQTADVDLLLFVGGDGTARDIYSAIGEALPVLGIPAGVKIHSSVYAVNPRRVGDLVRLFLAGRAPLREMEVLDIDEELFRQGRVTASLYGYLNVPYERRLLQGPKAGSPPSDQKPKEIAAYVVDHMDEGYLYVLGPGSTVFAIGERLGIDKTLLGVDVVYGNQVIGKDVNEQTLLRLIRGKKAKIVVTVIGGQGYIFGRGNQQISPAVLTAVGKENVIVIATQEKLLSLNSALLVDTGDAECDRGLSGYTRVITGYNEESIWKVEY
jgi:predicted polyphosphate/ATP-dependent NAD kinase